MSGLAVRGLLALAVTAALAPLVLTVLRRGQVLDHVTERSSHDRPTPRGGGVACGLGALVALGLTPAVDGSQRLTLALVATAFGLVGLVEDLAGIRALPRLAIQTALAMAAAPLLLVRPIDPPLLAAATAATATVWVVAYVNAFNFMDGVNGISVAQAVAAGVSWMLVGTVADAPILAVSGAIVTGAALGFAPYNVPQARMFLGDVGSYFVGAWLAATAVLALEAGVAPEAVLAPLVLYGADTGTTLLRRICKGEKWYSPHRDHAYQRLGDLRWSHVQISTFVAVCIGLCGALGAVSLGGSVSARGLADIAIVAVVGAYLLTPRWLSRRRSTMVVA